MVIRGAEAIAALARRFPQLYVEPAEDAEAAWKLASGRGIAPEGASLGHFATSDDDELRQVDTPAGDVDVLYLANRADFERFLQIIGHKAHPDPIAASIGAMTYRGIADWEAVASARAEYLASGGDDWPGEFARLARQPGAFRAEMIVISGGPYSGVDASLTPYSAEEWPAISREIRLHHECAHVVCRRLMPDDILPVWDEVTADMVGLLRATGGFDAGLEATFLGVGDDGIGEGRLVEYLDEDQLGRADEIAREVIGALRELQAKLEGEDPARAFDILLEEKRSPLIGY